MPRVSLSRWCSPTALRLPPPLPEATGTFCGVTGGGKAALALWPPGRVHRIFIVIVLCAYHGPTDTQDLDSQLVQTCGYAACCMACKKVDLAEFISSFFLSVQAIPVRNFYLRSRPGMRRGREAVQPSPEMREVRREIVSTFEVCPCLLSCSCRLSD